MLTSILIGIAGLVALVLLLMFLYACWIVHTITQVERVPVTGHPSNWGIQWEDASFLSRNDNLPLRGWYLPSEADDRCIILIQGTEHHRNSPEIRALRLGRDLVERGFSVLLFFNEMFLDTFSPGHKTCDICFNERCDMRGCFF